MSSTPLRSLSTRFTPLAVCLLALWAAPGLHPVHASTETILYSFTFGDASNPSGGVVLGKKGNLFGLTPAGGDFSAGTIYEVTPSGGEVTLYSFNGGSDGALPQGNLVIDKAGNLYGANCASGDFNSGTLFKLSPSNTFTLLYTFTGGADGSCPTGGMFRDKVGNLYGTAFRGGASNSGTVFKLTPSGTFTVLYAFGGGGDGIFPNGGLAIDGKGDLYGTTYGGGKYNLGTLYKLSSTGVHKVYWNFSGGADGSSPNGGLVLFKGIYFGTTVTGGTGGAGILYAWSPTHPNGLGIYWSFTGGADGGNPHTGVVSDKRGNVYGTTGSGGASVLGTVFKVQVLAPPITETVLHSFSLGPDGNLPLGGVVLDKNGNLFGTTLDGGSDPTCNGGGGCGVVFEVTP